jgi:hypothetical protein
MRVADATVRGKCSLGHLCRRSTIGMAQADRHEAVVEIGAIGSQLIHFAMR